MKTIINFLIVCLIINANIFAQNNAVIQDEKVYKTIDEIELSTDVFYTQETLAKEQNPAIVFFHGGGWAVGSPSEFHSTCKRFAQKGFVTFSIHYRLCRNEDGSVPHTVFTPVECVKDARSAMRWVRENAATYNIDPHKIIAAGQSAGGQLALSTAMIDDVNEPSDNLDVSPVPNALLLFASNVNTMEAWADRLMGDRRKEIWSISPHHNLKAGLPPAIEFHGTKDCMVPYWVVDHFKEETTRLGNYFEMITYEGRPHYLAEGNEKYSSYFDEEILERTDKFLTKFGFMDP